MAYGPGESRFVEEKRHFEKPIPISDLVLLDRERCILCDRCTRFAKEVAGDPLIHFRTAATRPRSTRSPTTRSPRTSRGNTVQICPVGALTATPYRFKARPWDLDQVESHLHRLLGRLPHRRRSRRRNEVLRYQGVDIDPVNWGWLCDKGRFGFEAVNSRRPPRRARWSATAATLAEARWADALDRPRPTPSRTASTAAARRRRRARRRPPHQRGRLRLGQAGQGRHRHRQRRRPARRRPPGRGSCSACPGPPSTRPAPPAARCSSLGPDLKEELPVLFLRLRHAVVERRRHGHRARPAAHRRSPSCAAASLRHRPGDGRRRRRARCSTAARAAGGGIDAGRAGRGRRAARPTARSPSSSAAPSLAESRRRTVDAAAAVARRPPRASGSCSALRRANVHGALDMGLAPGLLPGRVTLDDGRDWFADGAGPRVPAERGPRRRRHPRTPPPTAASTCWCCSAPTRSPTSPTATSPRAASPAPAPSSPSTRFLTASSRQADVVLPAAGLRRGRRHHHQPRGPGQHRRARRSRRPAPPAPTG